MKRWLSLLGIGLLCISLAGAAQSSSSSEDPLGDYGDAPDGLSTEYVFNFEPQRDGHFPTLYRTERQPESVDYVLHRFPEQQAFLGQSVTTEHNALQVDRDLDDGWDPNSFVTCSAAALEVFVTVPESATEDVIYVNALFDWDHDGQWSGSSTCSFDRGERRVSEWGIQNLALHEAPYSLEPGFQGTITLPAVTTGAMPGELWTRLTITTEPVDEGRFTPVLQGGQGWNGQGDFEYGETEDYFTCLFFDEDKPLDGCPAPLTTQQPIDPPPGEQMPNAVDDASSTPPSTPVNVEVRINDTDPNGQPLTVITTSQAANGTVAINAGNDVTYTPADGFTGSDQFTYTVCNPDGNCDTALVTIDVAQTNGPPIAEEDAATSEPGSDVTVNVLDNDVDPDGDPLEIVDNSEAANGTVSCSEIACTYTPNDGFTGTDTFEYTISDGNGGTDTATVTITVTAPSADLSVSKDGPAQVNEGQAFSYTLTVTNDGPDEATNVAVVDTLPAGVEFVGATGAGWSCGLSNGTVTCTRPSLAAGASAAITIDVTAPLEVGTLINTASTSADEDDPNDDDNTDEEETQVVNTTLGISVVKSASPTSVPETGSQVTYTVEIANNSDVDAVTIEDISDDELNHLDLNGICGVPFTLEPSADAECTFTASIAGQAGENHVNTITVSGTDDDGDAVSNFDEATVTFVDVLPELTIEKSPNVPSVPETGGTVTFTATVTNAGEEPVTLTSLVDSQFGDLTDACVLGNGVNLAGSEAFSCEFTRTVSGNASGPDHTNTLTATAEDDDGNVANAQGDATVGFRDVAPSISVSKTPSPTSIPETGTSATFTVVVTNDGDEPVTLQALTDDQFGNLNGHGNCSLPQTMAGGASYECAFSESLTGDASGPDHANTVTAAAVDDEQNAVDAQATASIGFTDVTPDLSVTKTADKSSVPESGGDVEFTVTVTNEGNEAVTLEELEDDVFGDLNNRGDCALPQPIDVNGSYQCAFTEAISGTVGQDHVNTVTAEASDNEGNPWSGQDNATVAFTDVALDISVTKTADPASVLEAGGDVTFTVHVVNNSPEEVTLDALDDDQFGDLDGVGSCDVPQTLAAGGGSYSCQFSETLEGDASGPAHVNTVTATASDDDGNTDTEDDTATVAFTDAAPSISVSKTPSRSSVPETGDDVTFTIVVANDSSESVELTSLADDAFGNLNGQGDCVLPETLAADGGTYQCAFTTELAGDAGGPAHANTVTATAEDNEGTEATANDDATVAFTDVEPSLDVAKTADPTEVPETGGDVTFSIDVTNTGEEAVTLDAIVDSEFGDLNGVGDCATGGTIAAGATYSCSFAEVISGDASGPEHANTVTATASDDEDNDVSAQDSAAVGFSDVAPSLSVTKTASEDAVPETGGSVTFDVSVANTGDEPVTLTELSDSAFGNLQGVGDCATGGSIASGESYTCSFTETLEGDAGQSHQNTVTATVTDNDGTSTQASDSATVGFDDVLSSVSVTKLADPTSVDEPGGDVTFAVTVNNTGTEDVTLTSLADDVFGDLNGAGDCATGGTIPAGGSYACSFTATVSGDAGDVHRNTVTAEVQDDEANVDTASDDATVTIDDVGPAGLTVTKTANPTSIPETGSEVTYTVRVTNDSTIDDVEVTEVSDNRFGSLNGVCNVPFTLEPGESSDCSFAETISGDAGATHDNVVTARGTDDDGASVSGQDGASVAFSDVQPAISVAKSADNSSPDPGAEVTYTVTIANNTEESVVITSLSDDQVGGASASDCNATTIPANGSVTCMYTDTAPSDDNAELTNIVTVIAEDDEGNTETETASETITTPDTTPSINVSKSADDTTPDPGATVTYTVTITNNTNEELTIAALDDDQVSVSVDDCTSATIPSNGSVNCTYADTAPSDDNTQLTNTVTVTVKDDDGNTVTDDDTETITTTDTKPNITVTKSADNATPDPGATVTYTVTITNNTDESVGMTSLSDDQVGGASASDCNATVIPGNGAMTCSYTDTAPSDDNAELTNIVTVTVADDDDNTATASDSETVTTTDINPSITVEKTNDANGDGSFSDSETAPSSSTTVDFRVVITNKTSEDVTIDSISDDHHGVSVSDCDSPTVPGNASVTCSFSGTVDADETNTATVNVSDDDGNAASDSDTSTVTIDDGTWSKASLFFTGQGHSCSAGEVFATIKNGDDSGAMQRTTTYELWYIENGNPKNGTKIASGTIPALDPGESYQMEETASEGNGVYIFKAIQPIGHPGQREIWSEEINDDCN